MTDEVPVEVLPFCGHVNIRVGFNPVVVITLTPAQMQRLAVEGMEAAVKAQDWKATVAERMVGALEEGR